MIIINKVILIGRLTRDPKMRTTATGTNVTNFTIAVNRLRIDGEDRGSDFISCIAWRRQAENIAKYCYKGDQVAIEGHIQTGSYENQDGTRRYTTNIIVDTIEFLSTKQDGQQNEPEFSSNQEALSSAMNEDPFKDFGEEIELDEDSLPF